MMRVSNANWQSPADVERAAMFYRSRGYRVAVITQSSERAGAFTYLQCEPLPC